MLQLLSQPELLNFSFVFICHNVKYQSRKIHKIIVHYPLEVREFVHVKIILDISVFRSYFKVTSALKR